MIMPKNYAKFTFEDLRQLGLTTVLARLFPVEIPQSISPSTWLKDSLSRNEGLSLNTEKAKSEFIIAPVLNELRQHNKAVFAVYSGYNFMVDAQRGLQGFCDFLLAKLPLSIIPETPIIAVVEAKLKQDLSAAVPQCAAEMYATQLWNQQRNEPLAVVYGVITTVTYGCFCVLKGSKLP